MLLGEALVEIQGYKKVVISLSVNEVLAPIYKRVNSSLSLPQISRNSGLR